MITQETYDKELAPLARALVEKARKLNCSCLVAVQVGENAHISGHKINASPKMEQAFAILFQDDEQ